MRVVNATVIRKVADMSHDIDKRCIKRDVCEMARCLMVENCDHAATKSEVASTLPASNSASLPCDQHSAGKDCWMTDIARCSDKPCLITRQA
jgi:hypothetical protein